MRTSGKKINPSLKNQIIKSLALVLVGFENINDADKFLRDFFTDSELETFSKRLAIAYWLKKKRSYNNIRDNLKVSSATVAFIQSMMKKSGFQKAIKELEADEWANQWVKKIKSFVGD